MASCWIEVDLNAVRENYRALHALLGPDIDIIAVVKADAYGLGALETSRVLADEGARYLAVTRIEEAQFLRQGGISAPILMLAPAPHEDVDALLELDVTACLGAEDDIEQLINAAQHHDKTARCGLKINTGMNRFGFSADRSAGCGATYRQRATIEIGDVLDAFDGCGRNQAAASAPAIWTFHAADNFAGPHCRFVAARFSHAPIPPRFYVFPRCACRACAREPFCLANFPAQPRAKPEKLPV